MPTRPYSQDGCATAGGGFKIGDFSKGLVVLNLAPNNTSKQQFFRNFDRFAFLRCAIQVSEIK
jgi:hypothetical protein